LADVKSVKIDGATRVRSKVGLRSWDVQRLQYNVNEDEATAKVEYPEEVASSWSELFGEVVAGNLEGNWTVGIILADS
jgi:hypothetical protein